jgi:hypothetical protein
MPRFFDFQEVEVDLDIEIDEFLDKCNNSEKEYLIDALIEDGYLKKDCRENFKDYDYSVSEAHFVEAVDKLRNRWNMLTSEEEELILKIANRF